MKSIIAFLMCSVLVLVSYSQTFHLDTFSDSLKTRLVGANVIPHISYDISCCEELRITDNDQNDFLPGAFSPYVFTPLDTDGGVKLIDMTSNLKVTIGVRAAAGTVLRVALTSPRGSGVFVAPRLRDETKQTVSKDFELEELTFDFSNSSIRENFDTSTVEHLFLEINPTSGAFGIPDGVIHIDYLCFGDLPVNTPKTTCRKINTLSYDSSTFYVQDFEFGWEEELLVDNNDFSTVLPQTNCGISSILFTEEVPQTVSNSTFSFHLAKDSSPVNILSNPQVNIKTSTSNSGRPFLDIYFEDVNNNSSSGSYFARLAYETSRTDDWYYINASFDPRNENVGCNDKFDFTKVTKVNILPYKTGFPAEIQNFDYIIVGETPADLNSFCVTSINEKNANETSNALYPNPVENLIYFSEPVNGKIEVLNHRGELILEFLANEKSIDQLKIEDLVPGIYHVIISNHNTTSQHKFLKN